jgi:hypothetical protein
VLLAKEEMVLQGVICTLVETGRYCKMEMNVEETKVMRISRQPGPSQIMTAQKQLENVQYLNYLGSMMHEARCICKIKSRITVVKAAFNRKKTVFASKSDFKFKDETNQVLHLEHNSVWC